MNTIGIILALAIIISVYAGLNYYLYRKISHLFSVSSRLLAIIILLFAASLLIAEMILHSHYPINAKPIAWVSSLWLGFIFLFFVMHICVDLIWSIFKSRLAGKISEKSVTTVIIFMVVVISTGGIQQAREVNIIPVTIASDKLSNPLTIVQISDLHLGVMSDRGHVQRLVEKINALQPDFIVSTGDLVDMDLPSLNGFERDLSTLKASIGKYAVFGNHERLAGIEGAAEFIRRAGFQVLSNEVVAASEIYIAGVDDPSMIGRLRNRGVDEHRLLIPYNSQFTLLLKHRPKVDAVNDFDLQLSGHTHGGQIFPFGLITKLIYRYPMGLSQVGDQSWLYISRGTGTWGPPMRIGADPEVTLIRLQPRR